MRFSVILHTVQLMSQTISEMFLTGSQFQAVVSYRCLLTYLLYSSLIRDSQQIISKTVSSLKFSNICCTPVPFSLEKLMF